MELAQWPGLVWRRGGGLSRAPPAGDMQNAGAREGVGKIVSKKKKAKFTRKRVDIYSCLCYTLIKRRSPP